MTITIKQLLPCELTWLFVPARIHTDRLSMVV